MSDYIDPYLTAVFSITVGMVGLLIALVICRKDKSIRRSIYSAMGEYSIITILLFLFFNGANNVLFILGYVLIAFISGVHYALVMKKAVREGLLLTLDKFPILHLTYNIGYTLMASGITVGWMVGIRPMALTVVAFLYMVILTIAGDNITAWGYLRKLFRY